MSGSDEAQDWPSVSVIMPILAEERHLADAVARVLAQDYPGPLEVVLAIGPSRDRTQEIAARLAEEDARVRWVPLQRAPIRSVATGDSIWPASTRPSAALQARAA